MPSPARPGLPRQNSRVRFYRGEMSPVHTTASDSTHGAWEHEIGPSGGAHDGADAAGGDARSYALDGNPSFGGEEIALTASDGAGYHGVPTEEPQSYYHPPALAPAPPPQPQSHAPDGYTSTPPRVGGRHYSVSTPHRPTLEPIASTYTVDVSPRNSTYVDAGAGAPGAELAHAAYQPAPTAQPSPARAASVQDAPAQPSPQRAGSQLVRPGSAQPRPLRSAMAGGRESAIRQQQDGGAGQYAQYVQYVPPPPPAPTGSPARRMLEEQQQRAAAAAPLPPSPVPAPTGYTPAGHAYHTPPPPRWVPHAGAQQTPRHSPNPDVFGSPAPAAPYNPYTGGSPVPPYPRESLAPAPFPGTWDPGYAAVHGTPARADGRGSDSTLRGSWESGKAKLSPQPEYYDPKRGDSPMHRVTTREAEGGGRLSSHGTGELGDDGGGDGESYRVRGGVFSHLLKLAGRSDTMRRRASSRATSTGAGDLPTLKSLGLQRGSSVASTTVGGVDELDPDDPRVTGQKKRRRSSMSGFLHQAGDPRERRARIRRHVADMITRQNFILKLAKALMAFGAPSHRIESQLSATALVLEIDAQFIHLPTIVIASFGDSDTRTSETHFVKSGGGLDLGRLHKVHSIYREVVHDKIDAAEGTARIHELLKAPLQYRLWQRIIMAFIASAMVCPVAFSGSIIDGLASGVLATMLAFLQLHVASKSSMYSNIFEIGIATFISFVARGLSATNYFCYEAIASAGVCLILPGYTILCGSLELANKNIVSGSVRMVYAIIYSLFLGFGITIGSDLFYLFDPRARAVQTAAATAAEGLTMTGTFLPDLLNSTLVPFNGTWTFTNSTASSVATALASGSVTCVRDPGWPWWRSAMPRIWLLLTVPVYTVLSSMWNMQPLRSRQLPVMVVISCIGYASNQLANHYIFDRSDVVSAIGAFVIGILGNVYSRVFGGTAFTSMVPGVLFLVPSGIAAAGGLAMTSTAGQSDSYSQGLIIGFRMVQVAIGITVGLFGSGILIYSFGRKKGAALFAF